MARTRRWTLTLLAAAALIMLLAADTVGQDWPQFRGEFRDGVSREKDLLQSWPESGPKEVWRQSIGDGYSGIAIVGDRLYTMYATAGDEPTEVAAAFDANTGKELWNTPMSERFDNGFGDGPRSTPTVDGDTVYVLSSRGVLAALSTEDGSERWKLSLTEAFGSAVPTFGFSTSTLVDGDQLIVEGGGTEGKSYAALDKKTGKVQWTLGEGPPGYNSPLPIQVGGETRYVYFGSGKLNCVNAKGEEVWSHVWPEAETHAMPIFIPPNQVFGSGAEGAGAALYKVHEEEGKATVEEVWTMPFMRNHFSSSVYHDGHIYGFDNATLKCISLVDGKMQWGKRGLGKGSLILADGRLVILTDQGKLLLAKASPDGWEETGSVQALKGKCWTSPTLANGRLYLRNHTEMVSYEVKN